VSGLDLARDRWLERFPAFLNGRDEPAGLLARRRAALAAFAATGFPSTRLEEWRYTNVAPLVEIPFELPGPGHGEVSRRDVEGLAFPVYACTLFVFVDGRFDPALSTPLPDQGVGVTSLARASRETAGPGLLRLAHEPDPKRHPFAALNTAFFEDAAWVSVPEGVEAPAPIHLVFLTTERASPTATKPRVLLEVGPSSRVTVVQDHVSLSDGPSFTNAVSEVTCGRNARVDLVLLQRESRASFHVCNVSARVERDAHFACHTTSLGGRLVRNDLQVVLADEGAEATLNGLFLGRGDEVVDNHTLVDHAMPHGTSFELYKGILADRSRGVFRGRIIVRPDAQKTDARQSNANILIGDGAEIDTKPQLEIRADDVKCAHGSTIGRLDEEALYYLRSRGIAETAARKLLTRGFAAEVLDSLPEAALRESLSDLLLERLAAPGGPE
jgi:Fe-S cluster assembly protein SufD